MRYHIFNCKDSVKPVFSAPFKSFAWCYYYACMHSWNYCRIIDTHSNKTLHEWVRALSNANNVHYKNAIMFKENQDNLINVLDLIKDEEFIELGSMKILFYHRYNYTYSGIGVITNMNLRDLWNIISAIQIYQQKDGYIDEFCEMEIIYLLCHFFECIPVSRAPVAFDCSLDLYINWNLGMIDTYGNQQLDVEFILPVEIKNKIDHIEEIHNANRKTLKRME